MPEVIASARGGLRALAAVVLAIGALASAPVAGADPFTDQAPSGPRITADYPGNDKASIVRRLAAVNVIIEAFDDHVGLRRQEGALTPEEERLSTGYAEVLQSAQKASRDTGQGPANYEAAGAMQRDAAFEREVLGRYFSAAIVGEAVAKRQEAYARMAQPAPGPPPQLPSGSGMPSGPGLIAAAVGGLLAVFGLLGMARAAGDYKYEPATRRLVLPTGEGVLNYHAGHVKDYKSHTTIESIRGTLTTGFVQNTIDLSVNSRTKEYIRLVTRAGEEHPIIVGDWNVMPTIGDRFAIFWVTPRGQTGGRFIAYRNYTTRQERINTTLLRAAFGSGPVTNLLVLAGAVTLGAGLLGWPGGLMGAGAAFLVMWLGRVALWRPNADRFIRSDLAAAVQKIESEI